MSEGLNRVSLLGNLGADPELRTTSGGQSVLKIRLATAERYKDRDGQWQERTEWHSVVLWGARADALSKIIGKGERIFVEGRLSTSNYEKEGVKHYRTEVVATNILLLGGKGGGAQRESGPRPQAHANAPPRQGSFPDDGGGDLGLDGDDIPF